MFLSHSWVQPVQQMGSCRCVILAFIPSLVGLVLRSVHSQSLDVQS
jgi:hypothetical protein